MKRNGYYDVDGKFYTRDKNATRDNPLAPRGPRHHHLHYLEGLNGTSRDIKTRISSYKENVRTEEPKSEVYVNRKRKQVIILTIGLTAFLIAYILIMVAISFMGLIW